MRTSLLRRGLGTLLALTLLAAAPLITRATTDINTLRDTMRQSLVTLYRAPVMVILATVMSFIVSPRLAPLLLACIPLLAVVMTILLKVGQPRFKRMLKMMDGMNQAVRENLVASRVVKAFVRGGYESKRFDKTTRPRSRCCRFPPLHRRGRR